MRPFKSKEKREEELGISLWKLAWRRFRRHKVGRVGGIIVLLLFIVLVLAEFIAPYSHTRQFRTLTYAPPTKIHSFDENGRLTRPFV